nr:MAG TPA: hypothetical protein [Caudoviricetes sp.]
MQKIINGDIMEPATEALLRKRSLDTVLDTYLKQLDKKLKSTDDCDTLRKKVKEDQSKFNNALKVMMDAKVKYDKGTIDKNQFKTLTRDAYKDISKYCKTFKVRMSDFGGGGFDAKSDITKEDIIDFKQYVTKLIAGVNLIKKRRIALAKEMNSKVGEKSTFSKDMKNIDKQTTNLTKTKATEAASTSNDAIHIIPFKGINNIKFGMTRDAVRAKLNSDESIMNEFRKSNKSTNTTDDFGFCHVYYDSKNKCEAIELFNDKSVMINNDAIIPGNIDNIKKLIPDLNKNGNEYISTSKSIGITTDNKGNVKSILLARKDYYNTKATESSLSFEEIFNVAMESLDSEEEQL